MQNSKCNAYITKGNQNVLGSRSPSRVSKRSECWLRTIESTANLSMSAAACPSVMIGKGDSTFKAQASCAPGRRAGHSCADSVIMQ